MFSLRVFGDVRHRTRRLHVLQEPMLLRPDSYVSRGLGRRRSRRRLLSAVLRNRFSRQDHGAGRKLRRFDGVFRGRPGSRDLPGFGFSSRRRLILAWLILGNRLSGKHDRPVGRRWPLLSGALVTRLLRGGSLLSCRTFLPFGVLALRRLLLCLTATLFAVLKTSASAATTTSSPPLARSFALRLAFALARSRCPSAVRAAG